MNKKGSQLDIIFFVIMLLIIGITTIIGYKVFIEFQGALEEKGVSTAEREILGHAGRTYGLLDGLYLILVSSMFIGAIVSTFFLNSHPIYFIGFALGLMLILIISVPLSEVYEKFSDNDQLENATASFASIDHIANRLPLWIFFVSLFMVIALFAKFKVGK